MNLNPKTVGVFHDKPLVYFAVFNSIHCTNNFSMDCFNVLQLLVSLLLLDYSNGSPPNIIMILADDLGWNDVSFHGSDQIPTPNIDALAYSGVILNRHYAQPLCTPSRAALMTGKYPIHTGQQWALFSPQRDGLPLSEKILPQYLKELGYATHIVGKWHLGFYKKPFTPLARGFDSHFGYWTGAISYYNHTNEDIANCTSGHDLKRNYSEAWDVQGQYATQLFTNEAVRLIECHSLDSPLFLYLSHLAPHAGRNKQGEFLEAPQEDVNQFSYISDPHRRKYAAMVSILDKSVGEILQALSKRDMLQNSIVLFLSDNGSPCQGNYRNWGSNFPFRGEKKTVWDGGVRVPAVVWSPLISQSSRVSNDLMHISDWLPTLLAAAGYKLSIENIDGVNQWSSISNGSPSPRSSLVVEIFERVHSLINGSFKYIKGTTRKYLPSMSHFLNMGIITSEDAPKYIQEDILQSKAWQAILNFTNYQNVENKFSILRREATVTCDHTNLTIYCDSKPCIFNIISDPCEQNDLSEHFPNLIEEFERELRDLRLNIYPRTEFLIDKNAFPNLHNGTWNIWLT